MKALILGVVIVAVGILAVLPSGLGWGEDVLIFLRGIFPVISFLIGLVLLFIGITDIKDRLDAKKDKEK